jgi:hypothetical protein
MSARSLPVPWRPPSSGCRPCRPTRAQRSGRSLSPARSRGTCRRSSSLYGRKWHSRLSRRRPLRAFSRSSPRTARAHQGEGRRARLARLARLRLAHLCPARLCLTRLCPVSPPQLAAEALPRPARHRSPPLRRLLLPRARTGPEARRMARRTSPAIRARARFRRSGLSGRDRLRRSPPHRPRRRSRPATRSRTRPSRTSRSRQSLRSKRTRPLPRKAPARPRRRLQSSPATGMPGATVRARGTVRSKPLRSWRVRRVTRRRARRARRCRRTARRPEVASAADSVTRS